MVDLGVVQVCKGADPQEVKQRLIESLPHDMLVKTKDELIDREIGFWNSSTPIGFVFSLGTVIGFVVGVIICYQVIYADIADHMPEYATLKAMGYGNGYFVRVVLQEAFYLSVLSFIPGLILSAALYQVLAQSTGLLMMLTFPRIAVIFLLTVAMCVVSGAMAMRKVLSADPADLY
jgi:putative ABC transport system permease protein